MTEEAKKATYHCTLPSYSLVLVMPTGQRHALQAQAGLIELTDPEQIAELDKFIASRSDVRHVMRKIDRGKIDPAAVKRQQEILAAQNRPAAIRGAVTSANRTVDTARQAGQDDKTVRIPAEPTNPAVSALGRLKTAKAVEPAKV